MSSITLDHIIIVVSNLDAALDQFTQLGFRVHPGGVHSSCFTHNALVPFSDGTYLELLSTIKPTSFHSLKVLKRLRLLGFYTTNQTAIERRLYDDLASGVGMNDYALLSLDLDHEVSRCNKLGLNFSNPIPGGRIRPDGREINWRTAVPQTNDLPFLIDDVTTRELRVPAIESNGHPNGITGIAGMTLLVSNHVESMARYRGLLGEEPKSQPIFPQPGTQTAEYAFEHRFISLSSPLPGNTNLRKLFQMRHGRPIGIFFETIEKEMGEYLSLTYLPEKGATLSRSHRLI
jgi:hypothetical protein